jgi:hypothetical protein
MQGSGLGSALADYAAADTKVAQMGLVNALIGQWASTSGF